MKKDYIKLQNANVTQVSKSNEKTDWLIRANKTGENLGTLPSKLTEKEVFSILDVARKFELEAFNVGINFGKQKQQESFSQIRKQLEERLRLAKNENERLADALDKATSTKK